MSGLLRLLDFDQKISYALVKPRSSKTPSIDVRCDSCHAARCQSCHRSESDEVLYAFELCPFLPCQIFLIRSDIGNVITMQKEILKVVFRKVCMRNGC